ncbi:MAG: fatty acyl-AMP ligase [Thermodesulfobacteria bacterium]|nr:fatty acyl-AMP ligase [Thermodesulfobacteriota bacterium]
MVEQRPTPTESEQPLKLAEFETLAEALDYAAQGRAGYNFYSGRGQLKLALPYRQLREEAQKLARKLLSLSLPRGSSVAIIAHTDPLFMRFFFACQYAGLVPVPLPIALQISSAQAYVEQLRGLLRIAEARAAVAPKEFLPSLSQAAEGLDLELVGGAEDFEELPESSLPLKPLQAEELAYIQFTSGSTRFPRGVMVTQRAVLHNLHLIARYGVRRREGDRAVSWLPFYHDMGLVGLVLATMASQVSVDFFSPKDFIMRPGLWLKLITQNRATVSFSPPFGYELAVLRLKDEDLQDLDLSSWRIAGVGAEMIRPQTLEKFAQRFARCGFHEKAFLPCYGMAECTLAVSFTELNRGAVVDVVDKDTLAPGERVSFREDGKELVRCGRPLPGLEIEIRDEMGRPLPEGYCGFLFVRGPSVMLGYRGDPEATREVLDEEGWLNTGDIAYLRDGEIVIAGRAKDVIIIYGRNIWPQDLEHVAESFPEVKAGNACAFAIPDEEGKDQAVLVVQARAKGEEAERLRREIAARIRSEFGIDCHVFLVPKNTIVRTTSGKPARSHTRRLCIERGFVPPEITKEGRLRLAKTGG